MAFYNRDNVPAENPLGLNETSISDKDKEAHQQLREDLVKNEEKQKQIDEKQGFEDAYEKQQEVVLNDGQKRGFWRKVYDRYLGKEMPHVTETTQERYKTFQEKAKGLETKEQNLAGAKAEVKLLEYEVAARKNKTEATSKDNSPVSKEDASALQKVIDGQKARAKYNGLKYANIGELLKNPTDVVAMETALSGIKKMDKKELPPEDLAVVNKMEFKLKHQIRKESFNEVAVLIGQDTKHKYTREQIKMFIVPPEGDTISKDELEKALEVFKNLRGDSNRPTEEEQLLARAEKIIRQLGNVSKESGAAQKTEKKTPDKKDTKTSDKQVDKSKPNKSTRQSKPKQPVKNEIVIDPVGETEQTLVQEELTPVEITPEKEHPTKKRQILFKKVGELLNKDKDTYYSDAEAKVFLNPSEVEKIDMTTAEYGLAALEKVRKNVSGNAENLLLVNQAEDILRLQADMKPRQEKNSSFLETKHEKNVRVFSEISKLIKEDKQQGYFKEEVDVFENPNLLSSLDQEDLQYGLAALERLSKKSDLSNDNLKSIKEAQDLLNSQIKEQKKTTNKEAVKSSSEAPTDKKENPEFVPFKGKDVVFGYNSILERFEPGKGSGEFKMSFNSKDGTIELVPSVDKFITKADFNNYYADFFDCPNPKGGSLDQVKPAILKQTGEGQFEVEKMGAIVVGD